MIMYNLESIAQQIATKASSIAVLDNLFKNEYLIDNITEEILTDIGFKFVSYDNRDNTPIYTMENLMACYKDNVLHLFQID